MERLLPRHVQIIRRLNADLLAALLIRRSIGRGRAD